MHLMFERNIQIPGTFVVLQGIPGDGLLNTIDSSPDFDHCPCDDQGHTFDLAQRQEQHQRQTPPAASFLLPTFLGQGLPASSRRPMVRSLSLKQQLVSAPNPRFPLPSTSGEAHATDSRHTEHQVTPAEDSFVFVDDGSPPQTAKVAAALPSRQAERDESTPDAPPDGASPLGDVASLHPLVREAILLWHEECAATQKRQAAEWLQSAVYQHNNSGHRSTSANPRTIPILFRLHPPSQPDKQPRLHQTNHRWWLDSRTAQLRVFNALPSPDPEDGGEVDECDRSCCVPPGTTLVGTAIHSFDLDEQSQKVLGGNKDDPWSYNGPCTNFNGSNEDSIQPEHCPRPGRIQFLQIESPEHGFVLFSVDGYAVLAPGLPSSSLFSGVVVHADEDEEQRSTPQRPQLCWWWKVTCHDGALVRQGLDLNTQHLCTLPFGTHVEVLRKVVNAVGLSRLLIKAHVYSINGQSQLVQGWCSEFLNPMAGLRGPILQPVPLAVPVQYRQVHPICTVRTHVELSSAVVQSLETVGRRVSVMGRHFTEFPTQNCVPRVRLGPQAYASLRLNADCSIDTNIPDTSGLVLEPTGMIDGNFDPASPGLYHWHAHSLWAVIQHPTPPARAIPREHGTDAPAARAPGGGVDLLSVGESLSSYSSSSSSSRQHKPTHVPAAQQQQDVPPKLCVCCKDKAPNATLVHGQTGHICCCLECARVLQAQNLACPICRCPIDNVILHFYS